MPLRVLLRESPQKSIALSTDTHALVFRHSPPTAQAANSIPQPGATRCMVEFSSLDRVDLTDYKSLRALNVYGTLGLINIDTDVFLCVISGAVRVASVRPGETVQRILSVEFCQ